MKWVWGHLSRGWEGQGGGRREGRGEPPESDKECATGVAQQKDTQVQFPPPICDSCVFVFRAGSHYVALNVLELTMWIRLTLNSQRFTYLSTCRVLRLRMCINTPREPGVLIASTKRLLLDFAP